MCKSVYKALFETKLDMTELFMRLLFSFVIGNSDMHLKNFTLIETHEASGIYTIKPAYDLLSVNVIMLEDTEEFALHYLMEKRHISAGKTSLSLRKNVGFQKHLPKK